MLESTSMVVAGAKSSPVNERKKLQAKGNRTETWIKVSLDLPRLKKQKMLVPRTKKKTVTPCPIWRTP